MPVYFGSLQNKPTKKGGTRSETTPQIRKNPANGSSEGLILGTFLNWFNVGEHGLVLDVNSRVPGSNSSTGRTISFHNFESKE